MFQGWKIAGTGLFGNLMLYGGMIYMMNVFITPLSELHGWSRALISSSMGIASFVVSLCTFAFIALTFHFKLRTLMTLGALIGGLGFIAMGLADSFLYFTIAFSVTWASGQLCGGAVANILVSNWFVAYRGRALGLVNIGISLAGVILPTVVLMLITLLGLKAAYISLGIIMLIFTPICFRVIRDNPSDMGLMPDNALASDVNADPKQSENLIIEKEAKFARTQELAGITKNFICFYKDKTSQLVSISYGLTLMAGAGIMSQLVPAFESYGISTSMATFMLSYFAICALVGKYFWGFVMDKTNPLLGMRLMLIGCLVGVLIFFMPPTTFSIFLFATVFGISSGGSWPVFAALLYYLYGKSYFKKAYQYGSVMIALKSFGYVIIGTLYTFFGSYTLSYALFFVILLISFVMTCMIKQTNSVEYLLRKDK